MSIKAHLKHTTHYQFDRPVVLYPHEIRLRPAAHNRTPFQDYLIDIEPKDHLIHWLQDANGNFVARVIFPKITSNLTIRIELVADLKVINPFDFFVEEWAAYFPFQYPPTSSRELASYLICDEVGPLFDAFLDAIRLDFTDSIMTTDFLVRLNLKIQEHIEYVVRLESGVQTPEETLMSKTGSCRDSAWLLVQILRHFGIASRFVSGYLIQMVPDQIPPEGWPGRDVDFVDLHAWSEAYVPGAGWIGMDTTSGLLVGEGHIPLAVSSIPDFAAPVTGQTGLCKAHLNIDMEVHRLTEELSVGLSNISSQRSTITTLGEIVTEEHGASL